MTPEFDIQIRLIPCDEHREPVDVASTPTTVRCVRNPTISIGAIRSELTWGDNPSREIHFSVMLEEPFPKVLAMPSELGEEPPTIATAPSTLLIYAMPPLTMMEASTCISIRLTLNGEEMTRRNQIRTRSIDPENGYDTYVIPFDEWPSENFDCRLIQEWRGGFTDICLLDFLKCNIVVMVIPGIRPDWHYPGGAFYNLDSLYGREDLADFETYSPYYFHASNCLPGSIIDDRISTSGINWFNNFMESTFRGTRTVTFDPPDVPFERTGIPDETPGEEDVVIRFETENTSDLRFILPNLNEPVIMRETRGGREFVWKTRHLNGKNAEMMPLPDNDCYYTGRRADSGVSRINPPRLEIWVSILMGMEEGGYYREIWADIYYNLETDS